MSQQNPPFTTERKGLNKRNGNIPRQAEHRLQNPIQPNKYLTRGPSLPAAT